ncbi:MAG: DUF1599 domain-containing protein [Weeksellaceae bacterium]|nr:DUF1599 domain-containing protein [Weeksellaceae bacterium]
MEKTIQQYRQITEECRRIFELKLQDYGPAWRILRMSSITDQIYIKANRIRTLQESQMRMVEEDEKPEFIGIFNYSIIALINLQLGVSSNVDIDEKEALQLFDSHIQQAQELMQRKNHDYGEAWRDMRISSITDMILQKILRIKQIEENSGKTKISEGLDANYLDMVNYAVFALILLQENHNSVQQKEALT